MNLPELIAAYRDGEITSPLAIDNDETYVYTDEGKAFSMGPGELLFEALDLLGVPCERV